MSVIRINKTKDYTVMSNHHLKEKEMSLKAKGLLSLMLSLPDDWDYSKKGLVNICKENKTSIDTTLAELKKFGYLKITRAKGTEMGRFDYVYDIFEVPELGFPCNGQMAGQMSDKCPPEIDLLCNENKEVCKISYEKPCKISTPEIDLPCIETPCTENPYTENPCTENQPQLNTNKLNTKKLNTKELSTKYIYGEFSHVKLTNEELDKLKETYGTSKTEEYITRLDEYLENNRKKKYDSHYLTIRNWIRKEDSNSTKKTNDGFWEAIIEEMEKGKKGIND